MHRFARARILALSATALSIVLSAPTVAAAAHPATTSDSAAAARHVVLLDWDGFDPSYLGRTPTPNIDALRARGSLSTAATTFRAISNPARTSLATGSYPATHHYAAYVYDPVANVVVGQNRSAAAENIAQSITRQGGTVASAGWYIVENRGTYAGNPNALYAAGANCVDDTSNAVRIVRGEPVLSGGTEVVVPEMPDLLAVYQVAGQCSALQGGGEGPRGRAG